MNTPVASITGTSLGGKDGLRDRLAKQAVLIVDGDKAMRGFYTRALQTLCRDVVEAATAQEATRLVSEQHFDLVFLDNVLPDISGIDWLRDQRALGFGAEVILVTAYADVDTVVHAMRAGASDFMLKPLRPNQLVAALSRVDTRLRTGKANARPQKERNADVLAARGRLLGRSPGIEAVRATFDKVARTALPVLFMGESGTGKEIAARTLHAMSDRAEKPFIAVNCAAISAERLCADLFGGEDNSAEAPQGLLAEAAGGTIFFDEVSELPEKVQGTLLRVIEDGRVRVGPEQREIPLNLRFLFSTNRDLARAVEDGQFRRDLFHRLNVIEVTMPPLRERVGDIPEFVALFNEQVSRELGVPPLELSEQIETNFAQGRWPGNVRELRNLVERSVVLGQLPSQFAGSGQRGRAEAVESLQAVERQHILTVLEACGGNRAEAARRLGISRKTIDRKCAIWNP